MSKPQNVTEDLFNIIDLLNEYILNAIIKVKKIIQMSFVKI